MRTLQINFDDFLGTLSQALRGASTDKVEVAFRLRPSNEFTVIDGNQRTTWQMKMPPTGEPTWVLYSLLTHILEFGNDVYAAFEGALKDGNGWVVVIVTPGHVSAEHRSSI